MRVIAGELKGRRLETPRDYQVRPTSDKVKGALFNIIGERIYDAVVCDPFAGTGSLGLEAISRGARMCYFGDHAGESIKLILDNVAHCGVSERASVIHGDYTKTFDRLKDSVDIFLLDPPYHKRELTEKAVALIREKQLLAENGMIIAEHHKRQQMPEELCGYEKIKERRYGIVVLSIYM